MKTSLSHKLFLCAVALTARILADIPVHAQGGGVPLWTNHYNGAANRNAGSTAVVVDGSGHVVVTGFSAFSAGTYGFPYYDYATIKYSNAGVPLWTNRYCGPENMDDVASAVGVDASGNIFVTGSSYGSNGYPDYATVAYSGAGVPLWTNRYGSANGYDAAYALAADSNGNVFVTGSSLGGGNPYYTVDYATIKYSNAGVPLWTNRYSSGQAHAIAVDGNGNVFVTGYSPGLGGVYDYLTIKYSGAGVPLWTNRYNGPSDGDDYANAIAVDGNGNVFVTGSSRSTNRYTDYATIKYSGAGVPLWTNRYDGPGNTDDSAFAMAVDGSGNVLVTGLSTSTSEYADYATIKYSNAGVPLWTNRYGEPGYDYSATIAVDASGNVFVTGYSSDARGTNYPNYLVTIAYSRTSLPLWTNRYSIGGNGPTDIVADKGGNVFVTGTSGFDYVTIKYSSMGGPLLTIAPTATNTVALSWPSPAAAFTLQQNTNVANTNWTAVGITPADDGTNKTVIIDPPEGNRFYRLVLP